MAIPDYESIMLPILTELQDGRERQVGELVPLFETRFALTPDERAQMLPSGKVTTFRSRLSWAGTYLVHAGLAKRPKRGWLQITDQGSMALAQPPNQIDVGFLNQYPEFVEWRARSGVKKHPITASSAVSIDETGLSPEESLEVSYQTLRSQLAEEILESLKLTSPRFFEKVVIDLLVAMGYGGSRFGVAQAIGGSGDGGVDGVIKEDRLGLDVVYVQAKRWQDSVGRPIVQGFTGSLEGHQANKGVLITTSTFTKEAMDFVRYISKRVVLIDGAQLAEFMIDHDVGVLDSATYVVKRLDNDYFLEA